jgi:hypothetical protein
MSEKCDACGDDQCPDKHLCDVVMPQHDAPPAKNPDYARRSLQRTYGIMERK